MPQLGAPPLSKQQRYEARMSLLSQARTKLAQQIPPLSAGALTAPADVTRLGAGPAARRLPAAPASAPGWGAAQAAATRLARNNVAVERARLSSHVYASDKIPPVPAPEGWHMLNAKELASHGVTPAVLRDDKSGFKAALYQSSFERPPKLVVAYAGTEDKVDMKADFKQGLGLEDDQYDRAMKLAQTVAKRTNSRQFDVTGHSLGGGLASAASVVTGVRGYTFNAAGLHPSTVGRAPYNVPFEEIAPKAKFIDAYHSAADPLTNAQINSGPVIGTGLPRALGIPHELAPAAKWQHKWGDVASRHPVDAGLKLALDGHGIDPQMVDHIEAEKDQDTATLTRYLAPTP